MLGSVENTGYIAAVDEVKKGEEVETPAADAVCGSGVTALDAQWSPPNPLPDPNTGVIVGVSNSECTAEGGCVAVDGDGNPADTTTVCGGKRLTKPSEVGYAGADTAVSGVIPPADGKFTVNCGSKTGRYLYVQLVGAQRLLWVGEIMAQFVVASSCTAGTDYASARGQYSDGSSCQDCPANSKGAGGTATTCTCADGYYATKSGGNVNTCTACPTGSSRTGSTIFGDSKEQDDSVCTANCAENKYWDGDSCEDCPANSVGAGGAATTCTCLSLIHISEPTRPY